MLFPPKLVVLAALVLFPQVTFAYLSPSTLSLIIASSGSVIIAFLAGLFAYGIIVFTWLRKHPRIVVTTLVAAVALTSFIFFKSFHDYKELKAINTFDDSIVYDVSSDWETFLKDYKEEHPEIDPDNFIANQQVSIRNILTLIPRISLEDAKKEGYKLVGTYCEPVPVDGATVICPISHLAFNNPLDEEMVHSIMSAHGISKETPIVTFCNSGVRSSLAALILEEYGYNVKARSSFWDLNNDYNKEKNIFSTLRAVNGDSVLAPILVDHFENLDIEKEDKFAYIVLDGVRQSEFDNNPEIKDLIETNRTHIFNVEPVYEEAGEEVFYEKIDLVQTGFFLSKKEVSVADYTTENSLGILTGDLEDGAKVICTNLLHCLSTRSYFDSIKAKVDRLYCINCPSDLTTI